MRHRRNFPFLFPFLLMGAALGGVALAKKGQRRTTTRREEDYEPPAPAPTSIAEPRPPAGGINVETATPRQIARFLTVYEREESVPPGVLSAYGRAWELVVRARAELRRGGMTGQLGDDLERLQSADMPFDRPGRFDRDTQTLVRDSLRRVAGLPRAPAVSPTEGWDRY